MLLENGLTTTQFCTKLEILIYAKKKGNKLPGFPL